MSHPNVRGELFDFMKHLPNFYEVHPVFGILTNYQSWRVAWLADEVTDSLAEESVEFDDYEECSPDDGGKEETEKIAQVESKAQTEGVPDLRRQAVSTRSFMLSRKKILTAKTKQKMLTMSQMRKDSFTCRKYFTEMIQRPCEQFVLQFSRCVRDAEFYWWQIAYPYMDMHREVWCKHEALRMPHFAVVQARDRSAKLLLVRQSWNPISTNKGLFTRMCLAQHCCIRRQERR